MRSTSRQTFGILRIVIGGALAIFGFFFALVREEFTCADVLIIGVCLAVFASGIRTLLDSKRSEKNAWDDQDW